MILLALFAFILLWCFFAIVFFFVLIFSGGKKPKRDAPIDVRAGERIVKP